MISNEEHTDFDFLEDINTEKLSRFFTRVAYNFINHTNKSVGGSKIRAIDLKNFTDNEWEQYYQDHIENFKLICTDYFKKEYVFVEKKKEEPNKEFLDAFKEFLLEFFPKETGQNEKAEVVQPCKEITEGGKELIQNELDQLEEAGKPGVKIHNLSENELLKTEEHREQEPTTLPKPEITYLIEDNPQKSPEDQALTDYLSDVLGSLKRPETPPDSEVVQEELTVSDYTNGLENDLHNICSGVTDLHIPVATEILLKPIGTGLSEFSADHTDEQDEPDMGFQQKLEEQRERHKQKLAEEKLKREEKQRKHDEELKEIRKQQQLCFRALFTCIQLKHRFEEKEQDVSAWIENCYKKPVLSLLKNFDNFADTAREWKHFKKVSEDSVEDARSEILYLHQKVYFVLETLQNSFGQLEQLSAMAPDALFLKVLQKTICGHGLVLNDLLDILEETQTDNDWYQKLEGSFWSIEPEKIPTTAALKRICPTSDVAEYEGLKFPERTVKSSVVIQEILEEEPTEQKTEDSSCCQCCEVEEQSPVDSGIHSPSWNIQQKFPI